MHKTSTTLADGRELIYFDEHPHTDRTGEDARDTRELPERAGGSELRYDALMDEWVAVAAHRQSRTFLPPSDQCPLCPSRPGNPSEIPASSYDVVVFENRFPSFSMDAPIPEPDPSIDGVGIDGVGIDGVGVDGARRAGTGRCEVVCFAADHHASLTSLPPERVRLLVDVWADRTTALGELDDVQQVFCFENRGEEIGVTLHHPHGQIYGYPFVPPRTRRMLDSARAHRDRTGGNLFADLLAIELAAKTRVVAETEHWVAFVPSAARWPVEVSIYPRRQVPDLPALTDTERADFAPLYGDLLRALDRYFDRPLPYIAAWQQAPVRTDRDLGYLHLQLFSLRRAPDKLKYLAGSESAMGVWINDVRPEQIAERVRELL